jgi:hypothetical protein
VELLEGHLVLEQGPAEGRFVVDERDLLLLVLRGGLGLELLGNGLTAMSAYFHNSAYLEHFLGTI